MLHYAEPKPFLVGEKCVKWQLFYDGRPVTEKFVAKDPRFAIRDAFVKLEEIREKRGRTFDLLYPENKWEVRIGE